MASPLREFFDVFLRKKDSTPIDPESMEAFLSDLTQVFNLSEDTMREYRMTGKAGTQYKIWLLGRQRGLADAVKDKSLAAPITGDVYTTALGLEKAWLTHARAVETAVRNQQARAVEQRFASAVPAAVAPVEPAARSFSQAEVERLLELERARVASAGVARQVRPAVMPQPVEYNSEGSEAPVVGGLVRRRARRTKAEMELERFNQQAEPVVPVAVQQNQ